MVSGFSLFLLISVFFLPKFNFIQLTPGAYLKLDDLLILIWVILVIFESKHRFSYRNKAHISAFLLLVLVFLISSVLNFLAGNVKIIESLAYSIRPFEYFLYFFVASRVNVSESFLINFLKIACLFYAVLVPLQYYGLVGVASDFSPDRAMAFTAGPFEFAVILSFVIIFFIEKKIKFWWIVIAFALLISTQSRITTFGLIIVLFIRHLRFDAKLFLFSLIGMALVLIAINFDEYNLIELSLANRIKELEVMDLDFVQKYLEKIPVINSRDDYFYYGYDILLSSDFSEGDASALIRIFRWSILLNYMIGLPFSVIFGLGPSFASVALDGYFIRLFVEVGILGVLTFLFFILKYYFSHRNNLILIQYLFVMLVTSLFIDIFMSSRAMFIFWFFAGLYGNSNILKHSKGIIDA